MKRILENIQNKPEPAKRLIMWSGVSLIMAVIFVFWLLTFPSQIPASENNEINFNSDASVGAPTFGRRGIKQELPTAWQSLKEQFNEIKNLWQR